MKIVYSDKHILRDSQTELFGGQLVEPFERPSRMDHILAQINATGVGELIGEQDFGMEAILKIHDADYVAFMQTVWDEWLAAGFEGEAMPTTWPARRMSDRIPDFVEGKLGYYSMSCETALTQGTWPAAYASAQVALTAANLLVTGAQTAAFALCRPPGHHAAIDMYGGYCFLNNAAIAAQHLLDKGAKRIAIVDVDFHHGNGTQDIFYKRNDVLFASLHGDPADAFPHFLGYSEETGQGDGVGFTRNYPMKPNTAFKEWRATLVDALGHVATYQPDAMIISLGVDTFENDPISFFKLKSDDFTTYGADIAKLGLPTMFVMEGGYDIGEIGVNTINVLQGFEAEQRKS
ncbi:MAG: histone deacetylase family protein [Paracoccaceae bacterium]|nr:histone deacetylase family protein [Paracoccaceae bacterium]